MLVFIYAKGRKEKVPFDNVFSLSNLASQRSYKNKLIVFFAPVEKSQCLHCLFSYKVTVTPAAAEVKLTTVTTPISVPRHDSARV